jgi:acid phosphatase
MQGQRYYTFALGPVIGPGTEVQVFALDSTTLDATQVKWLTRELARSRARWKVVLLHHPLYSSGRYGLQSRHR